MARIRKKTRTMWVRAFRHNIKSSGRDTILDGIGDIPSAVDIIVGIIGFTSQRHASGVYSTATLVAPVEVHAVESQSSIGAH